MWEKSVIGEKKNGAALAIPTLMATSVDDKGVSQNSTLSKQTKNF